MKPDGMMRKQLDSTYLHQLGERIESRSGTAWRPTYQWFVEHYDEARGTHKIQVASSGLRSQ